MRLAINFAIGLLFGVGLVISGMSDPAKVLNFLDVFGTWDPSLIFVMGGAVVTAFIGYRLVFARQRPILEPAFNVPARTEIDTPLLAGAAIFGIGWGLAGLCPGPAFTAIYSGTASIAVFLAAMLVGIAAARALHTAQAKALEA